VKIEVIPIRGGSKAVVAKLRKITRKIKNPSKANREVSIWLMRWVNRNFKTEGGKVGSWLPFKHGGRVGAGGIDKSAKLLRDTGRLQKSFSPFYSRTEAGIGTDLPYALTHELGKLSKNVPVRRMLPLASDRLVTDGILKIYDRWLERAIR